MKVCLICKYPPIEGGESSKAYWMAKGLGKKGHEIYVVTNAWEVESEFREKMTINEDIDAYQPKNVFIYNTNPFVNPHYIPYSRAYCEKLACLATEIIRLHSIPLIDSSYILPYGVSGFIAKTLTHCPQILRHAGSDLNRLLRSPYLNALFKAMLTKADKVVTPTAQMKQFLLTLGVQEERIFVCKPYVDIDAFNPNVTPADFTGMIKGDENTPIISYIGKIGMAKGIFELIMALNKIKENFALLLVANGPYIEKIRAMIKGTKIKKRCIFMGFLPPWRIPGVIRTSTCVVHPEKGFPIKGHAPILPREVMATGRCSVISDELYEKRAFREISDGIHTVVVNPSDTSEFKSKLKSLIKEPDHAYEIGREARKLSERKEDFKGYLNHVEKLYMSFSDIFT